MFTNVSNFHWMNSWYTCSISISILTCSSICISSCIKRFVTVMCVLTIIRTAVPLQVKTSNDHAVWSISSAFAWKCRITGAPLVTYKLLGVLTPREFGDGMHRPSRDTTNKTYQKIALTKRVLASYRWFFFFNDLPTTELIYFQNNHVSVLLIIFLIIYFFTSALLFNSTRYAK